MKAQKFEKLKKCGHDVLWIEMLTGRNCIYGSPSAITLTLLFILWSSTYCVSIVLNTELGTRNTKKTKHYSVISCHQWDAVILVRLVWLHSQLWRKYHLKQALVKRSIYEPKLYRSEYLVIPKKRKWISGWKLFK